ncbi:hypothetical protein COU49_00920 [Candidatus Nomurabacteria bacterium CG10_big_fil_rev_8_21_14_0_10_35_16]|uniref:Uncharacterized protein n=1 Tax=Candidatus Nomurabacteria bacterium CG10_big_fil_rev_8_21_14_0_10_35_16 TaxID=1974731 RepID=A0A2H0TBN2_9BACT|nr:MAG: hypothetical protein COU49_00920 [Candidatus Nomurabacteria bacterium CG10_big_fil_rev_8_21_14_0_10_35_16]
MKLIYILLLILVIPTTIFADTNDSNITIWNRIVKIFSSNENDNLNMVEELMGVDSEKKNEEVVAPKRIWPSIKSAANIFLSFLKELLPTIKNNNLENEDYFSEEIIKTQDLSGKWVGRYTIISPEECKTYHDSGEWNASLVKDNNNFSGQFDSFLVSGKTIVENNKWAVGSGSNFSFKGTVKGNTVDGSFSGPSCGSFLRDMLKNIEIISDMEFSQEKIYGQFFGGRILNE